MSVDIRFAGVKPDAVRISRRWISVILLLVFGLMSAKNLLANLADMTNGDCQEFAHIHIYKSKSMTAIQSELAKASSEEDKDCHDSKVLGHISLTPNAVSDLQPPVFAFVHKLSWKFENHFQIPFLEPHRRPPKVT